MTAVAFVLFDTAIGRCAIAWRGGSVVGFALPADDDEAIAAAMHRRWPDAVGAEPPEPIGEIIARASRLLAGEPIDLADVPVDLSGLPEFERRVLTELRRILPGETITYGALADRVGAPGAARAVGAAMARNPVPLIIPCHRVLAGGGRSGGFSAPGGVHTKFRILAIERARSSTAPSLFDDLPLAISPAAVR